MKDRLKFCQIKERIYFTSCQFEINTNIYNISFSDMYKNCNLFTVVQSVLLKLQEMVPI